ncbi:helix-turn-helix domain-containing protein [Burkholderia gladioli]|uniref:helix-turn-helix domain-containing protein n=1 Tax=Burkholderia gladioli TaxID=28095 RepID=UPI00163ED94D|nr:helix-turn-helix transcriptional regulator [Burkholderia gladioli]
MLTRNTDYLFFIRRLISTRVTNGITQLEIATALGKHQSFVSKYESGERRLDIAEFIAISRIIGIDPIKIMAEFLDENPQIPPSRSKVKRQKN